MSNSLGNGLLNKAYWSKKMQEYRKKKLVAMAICDVSEKAGLSSGDTIHKPYSSEVVGQSYTKGTAFTVQDVSAVDDTLTVSTARVAPFYIDDVDKIQNSYSAADEFSGKAQDKLNRFVDADVLAEYANATSYIDAGDVGGSAGTSITPDTTNINKIFTAAGRKLNLLNVAPENRFAVISPSILEVLQQYTAGKDTAVGDKVMDNGYIGSRFGFDLYVSNNLTYSAVWTPSDNPTAAETFIIGGVTFTFKADTMTAGALHICSDTENTLANMAVALNAPATAIVEATNAGYGALSAANQAKLEGITATATSTATPAPPLACQALTFNLGTPAPSPTATATPSGTPNSCGGTCGSNTSCQSAYFCYQGYCRNPECPTDSDCACSTTIPSTPGPTTPPVTRATQPPGEPSLPNAGIGSPTILSVGAGVILLLLSLALAL